MNDFIRSMSLAILIITSTLAGLVLTAPTASAGVSGNITVDTTWSGTVYVEGTVWVDSGVTLSIDPGTEVRFNGNYQLVVNGFLYANGTPSNRIMFRSNSSTPGIMDWGGIDTGTGAGIKTEYRYCDFSHFGNWIKTSRNTGDVYENCESSNGFGGVQIRSDWANVTNCTFNSMSGASISSDYNIINNVTLLDNMMYFSHADNNIITNLNHSGYAQLTIDSSDNNRFINGHADDGITFETNSDNNVVENYTIREWLEAFDSGHNTNNTVKNSTINVPMFTTMVLNQSSSLAIINSSHGDRNFLDLTSELWINWYMHVNVSFSTGLPASGVAVTVNDTYGNTIKIGTTGANGMLTDIECVEYRGNDTNGDHYDNAPGERIYYTPHNVTVEKDGMKEHADVTMDATKVVNIILVDNSAPSADSYAPTGVSAPLNSDISIQWNDSMNWTTVENSFEYTDGITTWDSTDGAWVHDNMALTSTFTPTVTFDFDTQYWVDINITATDAAGNPLDQDKDGTSGEWPEDVLNWTFTTAANSPPVITIVNPNAVADWTGGASHAVWWTYADNEDVVTDSLTIFLNYTSSDGSGVIAGPLFNETSLPYFWTIPAIDATDVVVHATIIDSNGAKGNFDTPVFTIDSTSPQLIGVSPVNNSIDISPSTNVILTFDESMNKADTEAAFSLENSTSAVAGTFTWNVQWTEMTFTPSQLLELDTVYWANITTGAKDDSQTGNAITSFYSANFKSISFVDTLGPLVVNPMIGPVNELFPTYDSYYDLWFNASIDDTNRGNSTIVDYEWIITHNSTMPTIPNGTGLSFPIADGVYDEINETVSIPVHGSYILFPGEEYWWIHGLDSEGNWGEWEYALLIIHDIVSPTVYSAHPTDLDESPSNTLIQVYFNDTMDQASVESAFSFSPDIDGVFSWERDWVFFAPNNLDDNTTYTITINGSIAKDSSGNYLDGNNNKIFEGSPIDDYIWSFTTWLDTDGDGIRDSIDGDDDNDGLPDDFDDLPTDPTEWVDSDNDGIGNNADPDDDNDGVNDTEDDFPLDPDETTDTDGDGIGDNEDTDDDGDGFLDEWEVVLGTSSTDPTDTPLDTDDDGIPDGDANNTESWMDTDDDGDDVSDELDADPLDPDISDIIDDPPDEDGGTNYLWLIILLVLVGVVGAFIVLRNKKKQEPEEMEEQKTTEEYNEDNMANVPYEELDK